jgi:hypothetical protein
MAISIAFLINSAFPQNNVQVVQFSVQRGFYDNPFQLTLSTVTFGADIYYTTDGSNPSSSNGILYSGPFDISTTTVVRAVAVRSGFNDSHISTHSYIFLKDVIHQPAVIEGYPNKIYWVGSNFYAQHDNEMDPEIVNDPAYKDAIIDGLLSIPTLSIVMDREDFWDVYDGDDVTRPASVELLYPHQPGKSTQVYCGLAGHSQQRLKRSLRLTFQSDYGGSNWISDIFQNAPLNGESATNEFDNIVLRGGNNRSWARIFNDDRVAYTRDQWYRDSQIAMSGIGSHGTFVHLYVNGLYWGLYNPVERPDENFTSTYLLGDEAEWFSISHSGIHNGDSQRWDYLTQELIKKDMSRAENYSQVQDYLDIDEFCDYLILSWYAGMSDWPDNNWWGGNRNNPPTPFQYYGWDCELAWDTTSGSNNGGWVHPDFRQNSSGASTLAAIWHALRVNENFMTRFADRVYRHCFNNGALTNENSQARWLTLNNFIRDAVIAESARWGDAMEENGHPTRTRDVDWQNEVDRLSELMSDNVERFISALRQENYYPSIDPPGLSQWGGNIPQDFTLYLLDGSNKGTIYYTLDGTDPREAGGGISPKAKTYDPSTAIPLRFTSTVKARTFYEDEWSALAEATFIGEQDFGAIKITEIMYHPDDWNGVDGDDFEFIEIKNTGRYLIDLSGVSFTSGISFSFLNGETISPGQFIVLATDEEAFTARYGSAPYATFEGKLDNAGERVTLSDSLGRQIFTVDYNDKYPWPTAADGEGYSLVPKFSNINANPDDAANWRASRYRGGSPGVDDSLAVNPTSVETIGESGPARFYLSHNYPNPFNSSTSIRYTLPEKSDVRMDVYNTKGQLVKSLLNVTQQPGEYVFFWDGRDDLGNDVPSGIYFYRVTMSNQGRQIEKANKMVLIR